MTQAKKKNRPDPLWQLMGLLFKAHPWHGVPIGVRAPEGVTVYIEIVPTDTVKYEMDKGSGLLKVDRPQRFSSVCPVPYGLVPQTFCGERVAELLSARTGRSGIVGDRDPLDICILTERTITHSDILMETVPIGGLSMIDGEEADDKIIAVLQGDSAYGEWRDISECPVAVVDRLRHYFLTYKTAPGSAKNKCEITSVYGREEALRVIRASHEDYMERFADIEGMLTAALRGIED
ncbi:MAG TPA: inorganic pyrophosphatase [Blastocatellia bacterium]|nr:inorganic pyrophosphatase [Blastocatellia bacterium]